jgi:N-succinyldiaminopimelate aminotransferase
MNPLLARLHPYPFERWREVTRDIVPNPKLAPLSLGIGEPQHAPPPGALQALVEALPTLGRYPATAGEPALREAIAAWLHRRHAVAVDPLTQVLPVNGTREALFAFAQTVIDPTRPGATVLCPNPFYQIYEGAALLAGAQTAFVAGDPARGFLPDWDHVPDATWARTQLVYVCSPDNPTGAVLALPHWQRLFELSDRHGFVIASDECYGEVYTNDLPPLGALAAARRLGRDDFRRLVMFTSLSKRSSLPGLRSGFVAGDAALLRAFLLYRTYHGGAMSPAVQRASIAAWGDEAHVQANRDAYRAKFDAVMPLLAPSLDVQRPTAGFYLWAGVPGGDDLAFARTLLQRANVTVLPGRLLARDMQGADGRVTNPGLGRVRLALVPPLHDCLDAAVRIADHARPVPAAAA